MTDKPLRRIVLILAPLKLWIATGGSPFPDRDLNK